MPPFVIADWFLSYVRHVLPSQQGDFDVIAYVEAYMEVLTALGDAENDLYSANFADYAGGGGTTVSQCSNGVYWLMTVDLASSFVLCVCT